MEKFVQLGKEFGLEGEKLLEFVREQQEKEEKRIQDEREEKRRQLEEEKEEKCREEEKEERRKQLEEETEERQRRKEEESEARRQEREIRKLQQKADIMRQKEAIEIAKREHGLELARIAATNGDGRTAERDERAKAPKVPSFVDGKDDLDAYLQRFERFAETAKWKKMDGHRSSVLCCLDKH